MQREIKFRAFYDGEMYDVIKFDFSKGEAGLGFFGNCYCGIKWRQIGAINLMQFTGLTDKNSKEIYEGDVLKTPYNNVYDFAYYRIVWDDRPAFYCHCLALHHKENGFKDISKGGYCEGFLESEKDKEVIGNIYEDENLLKK